MPAAFHQGGTQLLVHHPLRVRDQCQELAALDDLGVVVSDPRLGGQVEGLHHAEERFPALAALKLEHVVDPLLVDQFVHPPAPRLGKRLGLDFPAEQFVVIEVVGVFVIAQLVLEFGGVESFWLDQNV